MLLHSEEAAALVESTAPNARSRVVRGILASVVLLEAVSVLGYGCYLGVETIIDTATERGAAAVLAVSALALGLVLGMLARAVLRGRRAARAPIVVWQIMQIAVGYPAVPSRWYVAIPLVASAVVVLFLLFVPGAITEDVQRD